MSKAYIYAIEFSTGVVKVGTAIGIHGRIRAHETDALRYDVSIDRYWFREVSNSRRAEDALIAAVHDVGGEITHGREYFRGASWDDLVEAGERIAWREGVYARVG